MSETQVEPRADTARRLVEAAWEVMRSEGVRAATSRRITEMADVNLGAITYHFGSKDRLIAEAGVAAMDAWTRPLTDALLGDEQDRGNRTETVIGSVLGLLAGGREDARALLEAVLAPSIDDDVRATMAEHLLAFQQVVADLMRRQQEQGETPASVMPDAMAGLFTALALGLMLQEVIGASPAPIPDVVGQLLALLALGRDHSATAEEPSRR